MSEINRREFIKYALTGIAAFAGGAVAGRLVPVGPMLTRYGVRIKMAITEALVEMVDRTLVYHWAFEDLNQLNPAPRMPGPLISAIEGEDISLAITNTLPDVHGFRIPGVPGELGNGISINPGATRTVDFLAPEGGSYIYFDHLNAPVNRVLGLHGPMVVLPKYGNTPYSNPTPNVQKLFDHLGKTAHFPGDPWKPERTRIWLFHSIDPSFNEMARLRQKIDVTQFKEQFVPRYFTINGESGFYASHNHNTVPSGRIGQPLLIRIMNTGMNVDSPHIHGNHVYRVANRDAEGILTVQENVFLVDTFRDELAQCMDWLLPFIRPPDIPGDESKPVRQLIPNELALTLGGVGQSPLSYPMHGHNEQSQSAAGGNYPQGMVTHWEITGDLDGVDFPASNPEEKGGPNGSMLPSQ